MSLFRQLKSLAFVVFTCTSMGSAHAVVVSKNSGPTTPNLSDFPASFQSYPFKGGYNETSANRMFMETFQAGCPAGHKATTANFSITVKKLGGQSSNDALAFWDSQQQAWGTKIWSGSEPIGTVKSYNLNLAALPPVGGNVTHNTGLGIGLLSDGDFSFTVQDDTAVSTATLVYTCAGVDKKGLTFGQYPQHVVSGITTAACQGQPGGNCNAYQGDLSCNVALPVLCMRSMGLPNPASNTADPQHWSGAVMATTPDVAPATAGLNTKAQVDAYCAAQFGPGFVVGDFHAGGGWKFGAYGQFGNPAKRAWVNIKDQANANCWTQ
jgi:hypothetical protein